MKHKKAWSLLCALISSVIAWLKAILGLQNGELMPYAFSCSPIAETSAAAPAAALPDCADAAVATVAAGATPACTKTKNAALLAFHLFD